jgi:hypothetical protein
MEIFSLKNRTGRERDMESVKWLKGAEFKDLEEGLVI